MNGADPNLLDWLTEGTTPAQPPTTASVLVQLFEGTNGVKEIRPVPPTSPYPPKFFDTALEAAAYAAEVDGKRDCYIGAATRRAPDENGECTGTRDDVRELVALWADLDTPESVRELGKFMKPTILVETSPGRRQAWWLLKEPLSVAPPDAIWLTKEEKDNPEPDQRDLAEDLMRKIAHRLGADMASTDVARILRVPGSYNKKRSAPGRIIHADGPHYLVEDFLELELEAPPAKSIGSNGGGTFKPKFDMAGFLSGVPHGERNDATFRAACSMRSRGVRFEEATVLVLEAQKNADTDPGNPFTADEALGCLRRAFEKYPAGGSIEVRVGAAKEPPPPVPSTNLDGVITAFDKWLHMPDLDPLYATLGTVAANRRPGDPVWLMLVAPSSWGKTEILCSTSMLSDVYPTATITVAGLLSGTAEREKAKDAKGGLLRKIGDYGILCCKDFGSILSMPHESRGPLLAALREIFDGSWSRDVGVDGGKTLSWSGKLGFVGGCTPVIDTHHAVMASMGERFTIVRIRPQDDAKLARYALRHSGCEKGMRSELSTAVAGLFGNMDVCTNVPELTETEIQRLVDLTTLTVRTRSSIERDRQSREIELIPGAESPGRLTVTAAALLKGLHIIGLSRPDAWRVACRVVLDSAPTLRRKVLDVLSAATSPMTTTAIAEVAGYPSNTARRQLEDLTAYGVISRQGQGPGKADLWSLTDWTRERLAGLEGCLRNGRRGTE